MSALPPEADIQAVTLGVCCVPKADISDLDLNLLGEQLARRKVGIEQR
jgi:hypothetical protein